MSVQTLLLNQDRCTKNYNMYYDKTGTKEWQMLPWDLEESLGISSGLGGKPAPDYCTLECPQWNSPLYCDWNHTQVGLSIPFLQRQVCDSVWLFVKCGLSQVCNKNRRSPCISTCCSVCAALSIHAALSVRLSGHPTRSGCARQQPCWL